MKRIVCLLVTTLCLSAGCKRSSSDSSSAAESATPPASAAAAAPTIAAPRKPNSIPAPPDLTSPPKDAEKTPSGLATKVLTKGTGTDKPGLEDTVRANYTGWTTDGTMFDSSIPRGQPTSFRVKHVIKGWTEGLQLMVVGEKRRMWIPAALAYGEKPRGRAPAGDLVFDVELVDLVKAPEPPPVPEDVKKPPANAKKTQSGLRYRVLKPGTGKSPKATDMVVVHYSGWKTDGEMFDSSVVRGQPMTFRLDQVIKGWTEGVQLMKIGEKTRFWIPGELAYGDTPTRPGAPAGMLVFDIELIEVKEAPPQ
jgi:peptidylprolyl isomerase